MTAMGIPLQHGLGFPRLRFTVMTPFHVKHFTPVDCRHQQGHILLQSIAQQLPHFSGNLKPALEEADQGVGIEYISASPSAMRRVVTTSLSFARAPALQMTLQISKARPALA